MSDKQKEFKTILDTIELSGAMDRNTNGRSYNGRLGLNIPVDDDKLNLGISGAGFKNSNDSKNFITGIDAAYTKGNHTFGMSGNPFDKANHGFGLNYNYNDGDTGFSARFNQMSPEDKALFLNFTKQF